MEREVSIISGESARNIFLEDRRRNGRETLRKRDQETRSNFVESFRWETVICLPVRDSLFFFLPLAAFLSFSHSYLFLFYFFVLPRPAPSFSRLWRRACPFLSLSLSSLRTHTANRLPRKGPQGGALSLFCPHTCQRYIFRLGYKSFSG